MYFIISKKKAPYEAHCWADITGEKRTQANETSASTCTHTYHNFVFSLFHHFLHFSPTTSKLFII